jgi:hypothetical protein
VVLLVCLALTQVAFATQVGAASKKLTYSIKEARAYAVKGSLSKEVIEAVPKCDPEEDKYNCTGYNHKPNCPKKIEIGPRAKVPVPEPPRGVEPFAGGAGDNAALQEPPPQSTPVRINRFLVLAKQSNLFDVREAGGLASEQYVDQSGRSEPEAHTESEGFSGNASDYEERCFWNDDSGAKEEAYEHYLSRSGKAPNTYHLAECVGRQCNFGGGVNAERARSILNLIERDGKVIGTLRSSVEGLSFGDGALTIDSVISYVRFHTDGTPGGLKWSVASTASGGELGGQPVALPPGQDVSGPGFSVGMSRPFVGAPKDGRELTIVAPGLHFGSDQQAAFFGGAEVYMSMSRQTPFDFDPVPGEAPEAGGIPSGTGGGGGFGGSSIGTGGLDFPDGGSKTMTDAPAPVAAGESGKLLVFGKATGIGAVAAMIALGGIVWLLLLSRWLQRFSWGRRMTRMQPFRFIDWMYRAFVKT